MNNWIDQSIEKPNNDRRVKVKWDSERLAANGKPPIDDNFGYYDKYQNWWITENGESPNKSQPHYWKEVK